MNRLYADSSALLKRVIAEPESDAVAAVIHEHDARGDLVTASSLAWVEVWRALRRAQVPDLDDVAEAAVSGVAQLPLTERVVTQARRIGADSLRSLDALHLASAVSVGAEAILTYDDRLAACADALGIRVLRPGP